MKAQKIYNITMALIDEFKENGEVDMNSTKDYQARTPGILTQLSTIVAMEIRKYDKKIAIPDECKNLNSNIDLADEVCLAILPNGLAGKLLATEDANLSNYYNNLYEEQINKYMVQYRAKAVREDIEDVYGCDCRVGD